MSQDEKIEQMWKAAQDEHNKFQLAIGKLILAFADVEIMLYQLLRHYASMSDAVGRAIFSGARARFLIDCIKAIAHNTKVEQARITDMGEIFSHVNSINTMRDFLIHHVNGSEHAFDDSDPSTRVLTDARRVRRPEKAAKTMIGSAHVEAMAKDAITCCWRMQCHTDRANNPFQSLRMDTGKKPGAWLYKPLQLNIPNQQSAQSAQKRKDQRKSSQA